MANNRNKIDALHDLLPPHLNTKGNTNWKALVEALGQQDSDTSDLVSEVRKQFFVKTASRPYLDKLASNNKVARPRYVGMDDVSFREYIPVMSYKPKQVKTIIDQLLDVFFFKESTTAFVTTQVSSPFLLEDGWELTYSIDEANTEYIKFSSEEFTDISNATADEIVASINRQAKHSYATPYYDSVTKNTYIRMFTNTVGSKGSLRMLGGRANISLRFNGFISDAGNGNNTEWTVTKVGEEVVFQHTAGNSPGLDKVQVEDIMIINIPGNIGSFGIKKIDLVNNSITFINLFATVGVFTQTSAEQVKFIRPKKYAGYLNPRRAMSWETTPSEIVVEMPASPPVVKRSLKGAGHINGTFSLMSNRDSDTSMTLSDAYNFPNEGTFFIESVDEIKTNIITQDENTTTSKKINTRSISRVKKYTYTSRTSLATTGDIAEGGYQILNLASVVGLAIGQQVLMDGIPTYATVTGISGNIANLSHPATITATAGAVSFLGNTISGISPNLPDAATLNNFSLSSLSRTSGVVTATTISPHIFNVGDSVAISGSSGIVTSTTTADRTINSNQLTNVLSVNGLAPDMLISGAGIPTGTKIINIIGTTITMSNTATATSIAAGVNFHEALDGAFTIQSVTSNTFTYNLLGTNGAAVTAGLARLERPGMAMSGSRVYLSQSVPADTTRINGPYIWDLSAPFVLSSKNGTSADEIKAGKIVRLLNLNSNTIPAESGYIVIDYGLESQEGPIKYLYKPTDNTIAIDPSYTFQNNHEIGASISLVGKNGPHLMSGKGNEYPLYVTDPSDARIILQDLIRSVKSAGIFVNFLVRFPEQLYGLFDVYNANNGSS